MNETTLEEALKIEDIEITYPESNSENLIVNQDSRIKVVGILGCGAIANIITDFALKEKLDIDLSYFYDFDIHKAKKLASYVDGTAVKNINDMLDHVDLVIEAASPQAVREFIPQILKKGKDVIMMSLGALMDPGFKNHLEKIAQKNNSKIYAPSGAIAGLDCIKAASIGKIHNVSLITRKSPKSLGISTDNETIIFEGKASDAVLKFPKNINVAATLSIAYGKDVDVKIIADPAVDQNCHEIHVIGDFGELKTITQNKKCTTNPKTSVLAAYSAIKLLKSLNDYIRIGT